ncbi:MAG: uracil phosphoribosyltransferase [Nannocystaceae bacterium]|nr:uracil phosphoribosyltransferase [Nannocystaceae bacterium]
MTPNLHIVEHPLILHKLTLMRDKETSTSKFRALLEEIAMLMGYEVTRDLPTEMVEIETPLARTRAPMVAGKKVVVVSVLRAGTGMLDGILKVLPAARVGHIGLYRDPKTLQPIEYYFKVPAQMDTRQVILVDPMLATGNSIVAAVTRIKQTGAKHIKFVCLLAAPEGIRTLSAAHPDVAIYTPAVDERLDDHGYIVPGLGDAGDRLFGTK